MAKTPSEKKTLTILLSESFTLFYANRLLFTQSVSIFLIAEILLGRFIYFDVFAFSFSALFGGSFPFMVLIANVLSVFILLLYSMATVSMIVSLEHKKSLKVFDAYRQAFFQLPGIVWVLLNFVLKVFSWSLLLIVPGIIFAVFYSGCFLAFSVDGKVGEEALAFSKRLIRKHLFNYCDYLFFTVLLIFVIMVPVSHILDFTIMTLVKKMYVGLAFFINLIQVWLTGYAFNYGIIFIYTVYQELKRREGLLNLRNL